jgi:tetratricopeptide (TPR) repeat protein
MLGFEETMEQIKSGLTGRVERDVPYLINSGLECRKHRMFERIQREIGWMIFKLEPEDKSDSFRRAFGSDRLGLEKALKRAEHQIEISNFDRAANILETYTSRIKSSGISLASDIASSYHHFRNMLEIAIYTALYDEGAAFRIIPEDIGQLYTLYALALMRMKRIEESRQALNSAWIINPVRTDVMFLMADLDKLTGKMDEFLGITKTCLKCVYTDSDLGRCYRNLACYYSYIENYELSTALYFFSMSFDLESETARKELVNIQKITGKKLVVPEGDEIRRLCIENGIPIGPSEEILMFAFAIGEHLKKEGRYDKARFYYQVLLELTNSEEVKVILQNMPD